MAKKAHTEPYLDVVAIDDGTAFRSNQLRTEPSKRGGQSCWVQETDWSAGMKKLRDGIQREYTYARLKLFSPIRATGWRPARRDAEDFLRQIKQLRYELEGRRPIRFISFAAGTKLLCLAGELDRQQPVEDQSLPGDLIDGVALVGVIPLGDLRFGKSVLPRPRTARRPSMAVPFVRKSEDNEGYLYSFQDFGWEVRPKPNWAPPKTQSGTSMRRAPSTLSAIFHGFAEYQDIFEGLQHQIQSLRPHLLCAGTRRGDLNFVRSIERAMPSGGEEDISNKEKALTAALCVAAEGNQAEIAKTLLQRREGIGALVNGTNDHHLPIPLIVAVCAGSTDVISVFLQYNVKQTCRDADGRTPLMVACHVGQLSTVQLLLSVTKGGIDDVSPTKETALMLSAAHGYKDIVEKLVKHQPKPELGLKDAIGRTALILCCEKDQNETAQVLLKAQSNRDKMIDIKQNNGSAALHVALSRKNEALVKILLQYNADYNLKDGNDRSPAELAKSVSASQLLKGAELYAECSSDKLNLDKVKKLLGDGADIEYQGSPNGKTAVQVAKDSGNIELQDVLENRPLINGPRSHSTTETPKLPQWPARPEHIKCTTDVHGEIVDFHKDGGLEKRIRAIPHPTVDRILYRKQEEPTEELFFKNYAKIKDATFNFRHYHLPSNNLTWMKDLLTRLSLETGTINATDFEELLAGLTTAKDWKAGVSSYTNYGEKHIHSFELSNSFVDSLPFLRPQATRIRTPSQTQAQGEENILFIMPYLHYEDHGEYTQMAEYIRRKLQWGPNPAQSLRGSSDRNIEAHRQNRDSIPPASSIPEKVVDAYLSAEYPLHPRRSLDQFYYNIQNTKDRDKDQVVYRYAKRVGDTPKLFMVDQLWLWILNNGKTLVSSFPRQWEIKDEDQNDRLYEMQKTDVMSSILAKLNSQDRPEIHTAHEMGALIARYCFGTFFDPTRALGKPLRFVEIFENSIGNCSEKGTNLFRTLEKHLKDLQAESLNEDGGPSEQPKLLNIIDEIILLKEIKDIREELSIIDLVFDHQIRAIEDLIRILQQTARYSGDRRAAKSRRPIMSASTSTLTEADTQSDVPEQPPQQRSSEAQAERSRYRFEDLLITIQQNRKSMRKMDERAQRVYKDVNGLLDLKQKQASVFEADKTRQLAEDQAQILKNSEKQAETTARQGKTVLVFTMVTVLFLPASFMAAFFAIPIQSFPHDGGQPSLDMRWVIQWLMIVTVAFFVPLSTLAFYVNQIFRGSEEKKSYKSRVVELWARERAKKQEKRALAVPPSKTSGSNDPEKQVNGTATAVTGS